MGECEEETRGTGKGCHQKPWKGMCTGSLLSKGMRLLHLCLRVIYLVMWERIQDE